MIREQIQFLFLKLALIFILLIFLGGFGGYFWFHRQAASAAHELCAATKVGEPFDSGVFLKKAKALGMSAVSQNGGSFAFKSVLADKMFCAIKHPNGVIESSEVTLHLD